MEILPSPPPRGQSSAQTVQALKLKIEAGVSLSFLNITTFLSIYLVLLLELSEYNFIFLMAVLQAQMRRCQH